MEKINNSNYKKLIIVGGIILFFSIIFIYNLIKLGIFNQDSQKPTGLNNKVVFEQPKLTIFDETRYINQFPDKIHIHFPYFIVVVPEDTKQFTTVYSLTKKQKIASYNDIVLDYYDKSFLYNYHGGNTYYKGKNLKVHCNEGFIKSDSEILCVTQSANNSLFSDLIIINPHTLSEKTLYSPQDAITAVYYSNNTLYIGEYNYTTHQPFLTINNKRNTVTNYISIIYPMNNELYTATYKNTENKITDSYNEIIQSGKNNTLKLIDKGRIVFYSGK